MEKRQKSTLRSQHIRIADELILDEDIYAALRRDKIFTTGMLDMIKAEAKPRDRVYKLLELLEKRGPRAFEKFVCILKENYDWLAKVLEEQYNRRLQHSPQDRDMDQYSYAHYETQPQYMSNGTEWKYNRMEEYHDSNNTAIPVLTPRQIKIPTEETCSASYNDNEIQQFFQDPRCYNVGFSQQQQQQQQQQQNQQPTTTLNQQQKQNLCDSAQTLTISLPTVSDHDKEPKKKQYKDACISPIGIIESARQTRNTMGNAMKSHPNDDTLSETDTYDQGFDEILSETATAATSTTDDIESQNTGTTGVDGVGDDVVSENGDVVDGPEDVDVGLDEEDDDFPTSEVYYDGVRRGSTRFSNFDTYFEDECDMTTAEVSYEQTEAYKSNTEAMKALYIKLVDTTSDFEESEDHEETIVTWDMIQSEAGRLINMLQNSDDTKMIKKCYDLLFLSKDRRQPLNLCIEEALSQKKELENRLKDKQGEIDQMVFDLWKHQQDMSNIKKLKKSLADYETENKKLKTSSENFVRDVETKTILMEEKDLRIQELEKKIKELQEDLTKLQPGPPTRRGTQRKVPNPQGQPSPRRQPINHTDPRMPLMQGTYGGSQQSSRTTAMQRAPPVRKKIP